MTPSEAIVMLKYVGIGISDLSSLEGLRMGMEALEKQIPRKVKERKAGFKSFDYVCPECACRIISKIDGEWIAGNKSKHCYICGQKLDWSDAE